MFFVIATRKARRKGGYRTHYYCECVDGRPRFVGKADAPRFTEAGADVIAAQLREIAPTLSFHVMNVATRAPRAKKGEVVTSPKQPKQGDFDHGNL